MSFQVCDQARQLDVLDDRVLALQELVRGRREVDIFLTEHCRLQRVPVERIDEKEKRFDEKFERGTVSVPALVTKVDAAEQSLLDQGSLVLPSSELHDQLLDQGVLLRLRELGRWDQDSFTLGSCWGESFFAVHARVHLGVHDLEAGHRVEHVKLGLAKHLAAA